jgi:hypothetical protein
MSSRLDRVLESIDPRRTLEEVERRTDDALNGFAPATSQISRWDEFRAYLVRFLHHVEGRVLRLSQPCPMGTDFDWGRCVQFLMRAYGGSGEKTAFELARTGNEGGLYGVLKKMAQIIGEHYAENEVSAKVLFYWNGLSVPEKLAAADEYLGKYGHLLPSELTEGSAARLRANLPKVLEEHPRMLRRLRGVGRSW